MRNFFDTTLKILTPALHNHHRGTRHRKSATSGSLFVSERYSSSWMRSQNGRKTEKISTDRRVLQTDCRAFDCAVGEYIRNCGKCRFQVLSEKFARFTLRDLPNYLTCSYILKQTILSNRPTPSEDKIWGVFIIFQKSSCLGPINSSPTKS